MATDPLAAVQQYIDAFNKGDQGGMSAAFSVPGSILDGMASRLEVGHLQPLRIGIEMF